ncbi:Rab3 GTPase-activating protein catalytic subunit, partial [Trinorchestia longiramus]
TGSPEGPHVAGLLGEHLLEFLCASRDERSVPEVLGHAFADFGAQDSADVASALDRLTEHSVPSLGSVIMGRRSKRGSGEKTTDRTQSRSSMQAPSHRGSSQQGPLSADVLVSILNFLFPEEESDQEEESTAYPSVFGRVPSWHPTSHELPEEHPLKDVCVGLKSAPAEGLVWRLSLVCCHALHSLGGLPAVAHILYELMLELRFRWDNCIFVPGVSAAFEEPPPPDMAACLLQQKLQMLNCCIAHRERRERGTSTATTSAAASAGKASFLGFDEDEFFDCVSDEEEKETDTSKENNDELSSWDEPEGRVRVCGELRLLRAGRRLYVPATQDPAPVTEDRLEQQAEVLMRLGDTDEGSAMRARLMSSSLLSDMEAFKAANPGCILADFVRWYSPRDWIPVAAEVPPQGVEVIDGHRLSDRMTIPGNLWEEVWRNALPVPARRQKRLFDDAREAETVLQWLAKVTPGALCRHLLPVLLHAACCRTADEPHLYTLPSCAVWGPSSVYQAMEAVPALQHSEGLRALLTVITQRMGRLSRQPCDLKKYSDVIEQLGAVERCLGRAMSLRHKLLPAEARRPSSSQQKRKNNTRRSRNNSRRSSEALDSDDNEGKEAESDLSGLEASDDEVAANEAKRRDGKEDTAVLVSLISSLLSSGEVTVEGAAKGVPGQALLRLFERSIQEQERLGSLPRYSLEQRSSLPPSARRSLAEHTRSRLGYPGAREYIVRVRAEYPSPNSRVMPHRVYATFLKGDFRVAGLFTQDTSFS